MLFAVNGTLMRGFALNGNMLASGAVFVRETATAPVYRLWSICDRYPGMLRARESGAAIAVEVWQVDAKGLVQILEHEPPGLGIGRVKLEDDSRVWGVLAESYLVEGHVEITSYGGWRAYMASKPQADQASS